MADDGERIAIVGAGLAGCLLAVLLGRRGIAVTVFERRPDPRVAAPSGAGRSTWRSRRAASPRWTGSGCASGR
ncbi:hypothetical protein BJF79_32885 [Actinomadura sp. CNU-125]|uniref:FAD-dependent oxidoreductase n=1 Tax=Actinomadura sp. CNU-125 TaxID=1904961 RepID=UPI000968BC6C|nr:FAD-dependent oxidoreductase [Actinomadura sp. CNU-125]OLT34812.1 hypothetical protein BJF79_32885 [Actinomadura sp. CNU-125]